MNQDNFASKTKRVKFQWVLCSVCQLQSEHTAVYQVPPKSLHLLFPPHETRNKFWLQTLKSVPSLEDCHICKNSLKHSNRKVLCLRSGMHHTLHQIILHSSPLLKWLYLLGVSSSPDDWSSPVSGPCSSANCCNLQCDQFRKLERGDGGFEKMNGHTTREKAGT